MDGLPLDLIANASGWTVLGVLVAFGWLVPKRTVEREQKLLEKAADQWKSAHDTVAAQLSSVIEQLESAVQQPNGQRRGPAA